MDEVSVIWSEIAVKQRNSILHLKNYNIVYRFASPIIYILAFWDNRQNPETFKKILGL